MEPNFDDHAPADGPDLVAPETRWPRVIGIISLIYGIVGLLCATGQGVATFLSEFFLGLGGMDVSTPGVIKLTAIATALIGWVLGVVMVLGSVRLLRRMRSGVSLLKAWAVARLVVLALGVGVSIVLMPTSIAFNQQVRNEQNRMLREADRPELETLDEDAARQQGLLVLGAMSAITAAYPLFLGLYLSRRRVADEVAQWT